MASNQTKLRLIVIGAWFLSYACGDSTSPDGNGLSGSFTIVGQGVETNRWTSDLWVHGTFAYTGTWSTRNADRGDKLFVWDITDPTAPVLTDSVTVDASTVNDVKIDAAGTLAVITESSGITLLDLSDPAHPSLITRFTDGLGGGVHNVWIEGDYVYAVSNGTGDVKVIDVSALTPNIGASDW